jgi:hypothetical protein
MGIKFRWVLTHQRYACILTIIDYFTRQVLHWQVAYLITKNQLKSAWQAVIIDFLQPHQMLDEKLIIEVRNDNDSRFVAKEVQAYMTENHFSQVFTPLIPLKKAATSKAFMPFWASLWQNGHFPQSTTCKPIFPTSTKFIIA